MSGTEEQPGFPCTCGADNFQRVVVERVIGRPVVTDLVACVDCHIVYYLPLPKPEPAAPLPARHGMGSLGGAMPKGWIDPSLDSLERLKADARVAARDYVKPGRRTRSR